MVKDSDGVVTHYHYDLQGRLLAETDSDGTLRRAVVWYGDTPAALIDIEQSGPTFYTCTTTESLTGAAGPGMTLDTVTHTVVIEDGDYAGTYAISDENWQVYSSGIVFIWSGESFRLEGGFASDYELPTRSGALFVYQEDDEGNSQVIDVYKLWKESESGSSTIATPYQVHADQIGAPVLITDATGTAVWSAQYAPFGQATINSDVDGDGTDVVCNLRFPGQYFDAESGLHYNWHRYYEPRSGRYITLDPIGLDGGINSYAYSGDDPINSVDILGLMRSCPATKKLAQADNRNWRRYPKRSGEKLFHCGFSCYLEKRNNIEKECTENDPLNECCYDEKGLLVTCTHQYAYCKGTPGQYDQTEYPILHTLFDSGGIAGSGLDAFKESNKYKNDKYCSTYPKSRRCIRINMGK